MLVIISPAKRLDFDRKPLSFDREKQGFSEAPEFSKEAKELVDAARQLSPRDLSDLMRISADLAQLNHERFQAYEEEGRNCSMPAIQVFRGDVYLGFDVESLPTASLAYAQERLRILSGLYGVLRPFDLIQPYRLEMGSKLKTLKANNLYGFWGDMISISLNKAMEAAGASCLLNLASNEYFKAVRPAILKKPVLTIGFREYRDSVPVVISFNAKRARGLMSRFIIRNELRHPEELKAFAVEGYTFDVGLSDKGTWIFSRLFRRT